MFEYTELFRRGVGETTDVVNKEMYTFEDKGGRFSEIYSQTVNRVVITFFCGIAPITVSFLFVLFNQLARKGSRKGVRL